MTPQEAEDCAIEIVRSILDRQDDYRKIEEAVKERLPPGLLSDMSLAGYNPFGVFVVVLRELKRAKLPICCPHCVIGCVACGKNWLHK